jgi:hypothetical protein
MTTQSRRVTVAAGQELQVNFDLAEQALGLDEIVVTGAAGAARRREVGNAIAQIQVPAAPLSLPGAAISSVEWTEVAPGVQGIRVVQRVDGAPVELYFVGVQLDASASPGVQQAAAAAPPSSTGGTPAPSPAPPPPAVAPPPPAPSSAVQPPASLMAVPLPEGWRQLGQRFRGGWVVIRGPLSEARLRQLLELAGAGAPAR